MILALRHMDQKLKNLSLNMAKNNLFILVGLILLTCGKQSLKYIKTPPFLMFF